MFKLCVNTCFITFFGKRKSLGRSNEAKRSKTGNSLGGQKKNATSTIANEDLGQTSNWSKLVAAYLPVARLTIIDRLVIVFDKRVRSLLSRTNLVPRGPFCHALEGSRPLGTRLVTQRHSSEIQNWLVSRRSKLLS